MIGDENGKVPETMRPYRSGKPVKSIVCSDDFDNTKLGLHWQWNHNPIDNAWSLSERPGFLRLKTNRVVENLYLAPNTITQRMEGPTCSAYVKIDYSHMKDGDRAGFAAFNSETGALTLKKTGKTVCLEMEELSAQLSDREKAITKYDEKMIASVSLTKISPKSTKIWLRIDGDFRAGQRGGRDAANFYYSLDGEKWEKIGTTDYRMRFDWRRFFMGSKFAIFSYATKKAGGYIDVDSFNYKKIAE